MLLLLFIYNSSSLRRAFVFKTRNINIYYKEIEINVVLSSRCACVRLLNICCQNKEKTAFDIDINHKRGKNNTVIYTLISQWLIIYDHCCMRTATSVFLYPSSGARGIAWTDVCHEMCVKYWRWIPRNKHDGIMSSYVMGTTVS